MFELKKGKYSLKLDEGFQVDTELNHPLSANGEMPGSLTLPGDLPECPENNLILQSLICLEKRDGTRVYNGFEMHFNGEMLYSGQLVIFDAESALDTGKYTFSFIITGFAIDYAGKSLKDIDYGDNLPTGNTPEDVAAFAKAASQGSYPDYPCVFPMWFNTVFYGDANTEFLGVINHYDSTAEEYKINGPTLNEYALVPVLYLKFIFDKLFSGYKITGDFFTGTRLKAIIYNNYALDARSKQYYVRAHQTGSFSWPADTGTTTVNNIDVVDEDPDAIFAAPYYPVQTTGVHKVNGSFNYTLGGGATRAVWIVYVDGLLFGKGYHVPEADGDARGFFVSFKSSGFLPVTSVGDNIEIRVESEKEVGGIFTSAGCSITITNLEVEYINQDANEQNVYGSEIEFKNHVPDVKIEEFLEGFKKAGMVLNVFPFKRELKIDIVDDTFKKRPENISKYARDNYRKTFEDNAGYNFNFTFPDDELKPDELPDLSKYTLVNSVDIIEDADLPNDFLQMIYIRNLNQFWESEGDYIGGFTWKFLCHNYYDYKLGLGEEDMKLPFSPLLMSRDNVGGVMHLLPIHIEKGNSPIFSTGVNDTPFKLGFWHGFRFNGSTELYPFASSLDMDLEGIPAGDETLRFDDKWRGIITRWCGKYYMLLINGERVKMMFDFNSTFLRNFEWVQSYIVDNQRYLIVRVNTTYSENSIEPSETDLIKL